MGLLADMQKALEGWATWQRLLKAADKVDELERQIAELRGDKAAGPPRAACPKCGERRLMLTSSTSGVVFAGDGLVVDHFRCSACGHTEDRTRDELR